MISHSSFEFSYPDPGGLYTSTIVIGSPFVITLKQQNWLNLFILNLSHTKILSPDFVYLLCLYEGQFLVGIRGVIGLRLRLRRYTMFL